jgi:uncharacterized membrane protein
MAIDAGQISFRSVGVIRAPPGRSGRRSLVLTWRQSGCADRRGSRRTGSVRSAVRTASGYGAVMAQGRPTRSASKRSSPSHPRASAPPAATTSSTRARGRQLALVQVSVCVLAGLGVAVATAVFGPGWSAPLIGWDTAAATYLVWTWILVGRMDPTDTAEHAGIEDPTRSGADLLLLCAGVASLVAVGFVIVHGAHSQGLAKVLLTVFGIGSIVVSWLVVHTTYTLRYAKLFYDNAPGGVNFNQDEAPCYADFAYLAFTVGMTFQVSDTDLTSPTIRGNVLRHALLSYLYGAVIIAATINIVAGLSK